MCYYFVPAEARGDWLVTLRPQRGAISFECILIQKKAILKAYIT